MLARADDGGYVAARLDPLSSDLAEEFRAACDKALNQIEKRTHVAYSAGRKPDSHEVATTEAASVEPLGTVLAAIVPHSDLNIFETGGDLAAHVKLFVVTVETAQVHHFLRATSSKKRLKQTNKIAAIFTGTVFEALEDDPLLFDTSFDAAVVGDQLFILNQTGFERSLDFLEEARSLAGVAVRMAVANLPIANLEDFIDAVENDMNMISKSRSIAKRLENPEYASRMTISNLQAVIAEHPELDLDWLNEDSASGQLLFHPDPQRRWRLLKLLDDDFLQSLVTDVVYESNSKQSL